MKAKLLSLFLAVIFTTSCAPLPETTPEPLPIQESPAAATYITSWKRRATCNTCERKTIQVMHGYTSDGDLWKGHVCMCKGWQCLECKTILEKESQCCR